jgi:hypothetical protein
MFTRRSLIYFPLILASMLMLATTSMAQDNAAASSHSASAHRAPVHSTKRKGAAVKSASKVRTTPRGLTTILWDEEEGFPYCYLCICHRMTHYELCVDAGPWVDPCSCYTHDDKCCTNAPWPV